MKIRIFLPLLLAALLGFPPFVAHAAERRIALVVGESAYSRPLPTTANDAGLIAQTLQAAGFDVTGARDLDEEGLRAAFREFVDKASQGGPDTAAFIYFAGLGLQLDGENYLVPVDATMARDTDIPLRALRLSDYLKPLSTLGLKAAVVVLDAARENPFALSGAPIAGGLALYEPGPAALLAFNTAPGAIARDGDGPYGPYAQALAEMIRAGGMTLTQVFEQTRLRVSETTQGAQIPWNSAAVNSPFLFFERTAGAPPRPDLDPNLREQPLQQLGPESAFAVVIQQDSIRGYEEFLAIYPDHPLAKRVRALLAARREALCWRRARTLNTSEAYWSYTRRYPRGPHLGDAGRLLALRAAPPAPPPEFAPVDLGYPPPPPEELVYVDRPAFYPADPAFAFPPPPPPPVYLLPPPPPDFVVLPPPYAVAEVNVLPIPAFIPAPAYIRPPVYVAPPPNNFIYENIHNNIVVDRVTNNIVVNSPQGQTLSSHPLMTAGAVGAAAVVGGVVLPRVVKKVFAPAQVAPAGAGPQPAVAPPGAGLQPQPGAAPNHALPLTPSNSGLPATGAGVQPQPSAAPNHALPLSPSNPGQSATAPQHPAGSAPASAGAPAQPSPAPNHALPLTPSHPGQPTTAPQQHRAASPPAGAGAEPQPSAAPNHALPLSPSHPGLPTTAPQHAPTSAPPGAGAPPPEPHNAGHPPAGPHPGAPSGAGAPPEPHNAAHPPAEPHPATEPRPKPHAPPPASHLRSEPPPNRAQFFAPARPPAYGPTSVHAQTSPPGRPPAGYGSPPVRAQFFPPARPPAGYGPPPVHAPFFPSAHSPAGYGAPAFHPQVPHPAAPPAMAQVRVPRPAPVAPPPRPQPPAKHCVNVNGKEVCR